MDFNNSMFGQKTPNAYEQMVKQAQFNQLNQQNFYVQSQTKFDELQKSINSLSSEERNILVQNEQFIVSSRQYEQGLLAFITSNFRTQYNNTPEGQQLIINMEKSFNDSIKDVRKTIESEREQIKQVSDLIKNNPEILELLDKKSK